MRATFPELESFGDDREKVISHAADTLEKVISARVQDRRDILAPSTGETYAWLPTLTSIKVLLYQNMRDQGIGKAELARRLGWYLPQLDRVPDIQHRSVLDLIDDALGAIGRWLHVTAAVVSDRVVEPVRKRTDGTESPHMTSPCRQRSIIDDSR